MGLDNEVFNAFSVSTEQSEGEDGAAAFTIIFPFLNDTPDFAYHFEKGDLITPWVTVEPDSIEIIPGTGSTHTVRIDVAISANPENGSEFFRLVIETL